jgi:hypothetical protein
MRAESRATEPGAPRRPLLPRAAATYKAKAHGKED